MLRNSVESDQPQQQPPQKRVQQRLPAEKPTLIVQATGRAVYDGRAMSEVTLVSPYVWFRDETSGQAIEADYEYKNDILRIGGLPPGKFGVQVTYNANSANPVNYPGDFYSWT